MSEQYIVSGPIDELPITQEERNDLLRLLRISKSLEVQNAELLLELHEQAKRAVFAAKEAGSMLAGAALKDVLSIEDAVFKFHKSVREDENIRHKLAAKANRKRVNEFGDMDKREIQALINAISKTVTREQLMLMYPVDAE